MYSLTVVLKRIWKRKAGNLITAVQLFIGVALIVFSLNILMFTQTQNDELLNSAKDKMYTISIRNITQSPKSYIISRAQLESIKDTLELDTAISINYNIITFAGASHLENGENIADKYVVSFSEKVDGIFAEKEFADVLPKISVDNTVNFNDIDFGLINEYSIFDDGEKYLHSCVLPLEMYWKASRPSTFAEFDLEVACENVTNIEKMLDIEDILSESEEYDFLVSNDFYDFLEHASYAESSSSRTVLFSAIVLIVVFISMLCIFLLLIDERAFEIAVCRAAGAGTSAVFGEFVIELLFISLTPTLLSIISLGVIFKNEFQFIGILIPGMRTVPNLFAIWGILAADIICLIPVAFKIYRLRPYELLVSEGQHAY